jgi:hypothetical protein
MKKLSVLLYVIGIVQLILGLLYLFIPMQFLSIMGFIVPKPLTLPPLDPITTWHAGEPTSRIVAAYCYKT